jgi:rubrerythrin
MNQKREAEVWERVVAASAECPMPIKKAVPTELTARQVLELLQGELLDVCTYQTLAARVKKDARRCLWQLAQEERRHYRKLEAVYYLMTGQRPCPDRPKAPCMACTNEELRKRYKAEVEGAACYHAMAEKAGSFVSVFHCLGHEEDRHSRMILELLQRCL